MNPKEHPTKALIIFVKNPTLGKVKTRLAASIGDEAALAVYHNLLDHTRDVAEQVAAERCLFYDTEITEQDAWSTKHYSKAVQADGDLGARMKAAFAQTLEKIDKAIIIGSDCPEISAEVIEKAFKRLELADVVIGPTLDGGYYLLGIKELHAFLFDDMVWSTETVLEETIQRIQKKNLLYTKMPTLSDLDYEADLNNFPSFKA